MDPVTYLKNMTWTPILVLKFLALVLGVVIVASFIMNLFGAGISLKSAPHYLTVKGVQAPYDGAYRGSSYEYDSADVGYDDSIGYGIGGGATLSARNVAAIYPPQPYMGSVGESAEEYEVTEYSVSIESGNAERDCAAIRELKQKDYVVFESADEHERGCSFVFKVEKAHVDEIVTLLESYDPRELSESVRTIVRQIQDFTSQEDILKKRLDTVTDTLDSATTAYEDITALAIRTQNAETLSRVIESKLQIIERLTQERIAISSQLDSLARAKAEQLDRLEYTYFHVSIYENRVINSDHIRDTWRQAAMLTVQRINIILTEMSLGLLALAFLVGQWVFYALILLVLAKYGWRFVRAFWMR